MSYRYYFAEVEHRDDVCRRIEGLSLVPSRLAADSDRPISPADIPPGYALRRDPEEDWWILPEGYWDRWCEECVECLGHSDRDYITVDDHYYCDSDCAESAGYRQCHYCGTWGCEGDMWGATRAGETSWYCTQDCMERDGWIGSCGHCSDDVHSDDDYVIADHYLYCSAECFEADGWTWCVACGEPVRQEDMRGDYCDGCADSDGCGLRPYDARGYRSDSADPDKPWRIGVEIEKEDAEWIGKLVEAPGWCYKEDGSLDRACGFELVSPTWNLSDWEAIYREIRSLPEIDAQTSTACGGHITISHLTRRRGDLLRYLGDLVPLMYALYWRRLRNTYCSARRFAQIAESTDKYQSCRIREDGSVEFRIIARVHDRDQLIWRLDIFRHYLVGLGDIHQISADLVEGRWLGDHIAQRYSLEGFRRLHRRFRALREWYWSDILSDDRHEIFRHVCQYGDVPAGTLV